MADFAERARERTARESCAIPCARPREVSARRIRIGDTK